MMDYSELEQWLLEQGGPAIQLRIFSRQRGNKSEKDVGNSLSKLLGLKEVNTILNYLDAFKTQARDYKTLEHLIHYYKDTCIDKFFPKLLDLGFKAGMPVFDEKIQPVIELFSYLIAVDNHYCYNYRLMLHRFLFMAGYKHPELLESMEQRINALHRSAKERVFDIYQDGSSLPKVPKQWVDRGILKDELNPFSQEAPKPLPTIYDLSALAYFPDDYKNSVIQPKIDDIVEYILEPEFQKIPEYYGLLWVKARGIYHACGWGPALPLYEDYYRPDHIGIYTVLNYLKMMSYFKAAQKSKWFNNCIDYVQQFRTERGTYIFPKEYFDSKKYYHPGSTSDILGMNIKLDEAFLNESNLKLKRNEREIMVREIVSTLNMVEIYNDVLILKERKQ